MERSSEGRHEFIDGGLAAQNARWVTVYRRARRRDPAPRPAGDWREQPDAYGSGESFELPGLTRAIAVDEIYDRLLDAAGRSLLR